MPSHCISHVKDVDGISSAALSLAANGGTFRLTDYDALFQELDSVPASADSLVICDLGTDQSRFPDFRARLEALSRRMRVTYIDHHFISEESKNKIENLGIDLRHDTTESAAMLTFLTFQDRLPSEARLPALFGAVTDYMDGAPGASRLMESLDRQFILLESTLLSYALARKGGDYGYVESLVRELAAMRLPHQIDDVPRYALEQAEVVRKLADEVREKGVKMGRLAYMRTDQRATGNVAKLLLGAFDVCVGVAYTEKPNEIAEVSFRSTSDCRIHLGREISKIAQKYGGNGGGHEKAAGCSIPIQHVNTLLGEIDSLLQGT